MSHKCGNNCLRKSGMRCETCKASRHPHKEAGRLSTTIFASDLKTSRDLERLENRNQRKRLGQDTIDRYRAKIRREDAKNEPD